MATFPAGWTAPESWSPEYLARKLARPDVIYPEGGAAPIGSWIEEGRVITPTENGYTWTNPEVARAIDAFAPVDTALKLPSLGTVLKGAAKLGGQLLGITPAGGAPPINISLPPGTLVPGYPGGPAGGAPAGDPSCGQLMLMGKWVEYAKCMAGNAISYLPGGAPPATPGQWAGGTFGYQGGGQTSMGAFGVPTVEPGRATVARLKCPAGLVLGRDNKCYVKGTIPRKYRKWRPSSRPPITAGDAKAIRRAAGAKRRVKRLASDVGLSTHNRGSGRNHGPAKKK